MASASTLIKSGISTLGQSRLVTIFKIKELRQKILITILFLAIYRIGFHVPLPMINQYKMAQSLRGSDEGLLGLITMFSGGSLSQSTIFGLGIMPYISASIIFQLLASVYPPLEKLQKEGEAGRKKINEYTRYATVLICFVQALFWVLHISRGREAGGQDLAYEQYNTFWYILSSVVTMTVGTVFLMWIGEQIDEYGIGNGISLIIMAGIVCRIPDATASLILAHGGEPAMIIPLLGWKLRASIFTLGGGDTGGAVGLEKLIVLMIMFVVVVIAVIAITKGQRRIQPSRPSTCAAGASTAAALASPCRCASIRPASCPSSSPAACSSSRCSFSSGWPKSSTPTGLTVYRPPSSARGTSTTSVTSSSFISSVTSGPPSPSIPRTWPTT